MKTIRTYNSSYECAYTCFVSFSSATFRQRGSLSLPPRPRNQVAFEIRGKSATSGPEKFQGTCTSNKRARTTGGQKCSHARREKSPIARTLRSKIVQHDPVGSVSTPILSSSFPKDALTSRSRWRNDSRCRLRTVKVLNAPPKSVKNFLHDRISIGFVISMATFYRISNVGVERSRFKEFWRRLNKKLYNLSFKRRLWSQRPSRSGKFRHEKSFFNVSGGAFEPWQFSRTKVTSCKRYLWKELTKLSGSCHNLKNKKLTLFLFEVMTWDRQFRPSWYDPGIKFSSIAFSQFWLTRKFFNKNLITKTKCRKDTEKHSQANDKHSQVFGIYVKRW